MTSNMSITKRTRTPSPTPSLDSKRTRATKPVRFLILADTHNADLPSNLPSCDLVLHCGDITEDGSPASISAALASLGRIEASLKLVIAGNHDISLDKEYYTSEGGTLADVEKSLALVSPASSSTATNNGITFLHEGTHTFTLASGASFTIYASPFTPAYGASAFQYPSHHDRYNPASQTPEWATNVSTEQSLIPDHVDIVMTHGPAKYILDRTSDGTSAGYEHLRRAIARARPRLFCFGHVHCGYGAQRLAFGEDGVDDIVPAAKEWVGRNQTTKKGFARLAPSAVEVWGREEQTLAVNAAMEGEGGVLENAAWVVDLEL
jgi:hypothetical protein